MDPFQLSGQLIIADSIKNSLRQALPPKRPAIGGVNRMASIFLFERYGVDSPVE